VKVHHQVTFSSKNIPKSSSTQFALVFISSTS